MARASIWMIMIRGTSRRLLSTMRLAAGKAVRAVLRIDRFHRARAGLAIWGSKRHWCGFPSVLFVCWSFQGALPAVYRWLLDLLGSISKAVYDFCSRATYPNSPRNPDARNRRSMYQDIHHLGSHRVAARCCLGAWYQPTDHLAHHGAERRDIVPCKLLERLSASQAGLRHMEALLLSECVHDAVVRLQGR